MKLHILGTAGYHPNDQRHTACLMLPASGVVLDAGTAMYRVRDLLAAQTLDIFLTHSHLDHVVGLTYLLDVLHERDVQRVTVHGEAKKLEAVREHVFAPLIFPVPPPFESRPLTERIELPDGAAVSHFALKHPGGTVGYRIDWPDRSLAYVTDTTADKDADYVSAVKGVDVLVHECNFDDVDREYAIKTGHSHTTAVAEVARQAEAKRLVLLHVNPLAPSDAPLDLEAARRVFPQTEIACDQMVVDF